MSRTQICFLLGFFFVVANCQVVSGEIVFDFRSSGAAGAALDAGSSPQNPEALFTTQGVTVTVSPTTTLGSGLGVFNANGNGAGIDSIGAQGNVNNQTAIDPNETLSLTFTFSQSPLLRISELELKRQVGGQNNSEVHVDIENVRVSLSDGATDFNGSTDTWTPMSDYLIESGETIVFTGEDAYRLVRLELQAVPEPTSALLFLSSGLILLNTRRRRK